MLSGLQCFDAVGWAAGRASGLWKTEWWGADVVICPERGADLHLAHLMPLPLTVSCFSKIQIGFTFLVPAHPGSPGQRAVKRVCVCVCACVRACARDLDKLIDCLIVSATDLVGRGRETVCFPVVRPTGRVNRANCMLLNMR